MESPPMLRVAEQAPVEDVRASWPVAEEPPLPLPLAEPEPEPTPVSRWEPSPVIPEPPPLPATPPEPVPSVPVVPAEPAAETKPVSRKVRAAEAEEKARCSKCGSRDTWRFGRVKGLRRAIANMAGGQWVTCRGCGGRFLTRQFGPMEEDEDE